MKKYIFFLLLFALAFSKMAITQEVIQGLLWVTVTDETAKPLENSSRTSNVSVNEVFEDFGVTLYKPAFPNTRNELLLNTYEIEFAGNTDDFYAMLSNRFSTYFSNGGF